MATQTAVLNGWKEIANHLGRSVRTVQRYERVAGLPVHRPIPGDRGSVIAHPRELEAWCAPTYEETPFDMMERMGAAVTHCTRDLRYGKVNAKYADWLQRKPSDIEGKPIQEVLGDETFKVLLPYFEHVLKGNTVNYEEQVAFPVIGERWIAVNYTPTLDAEGKVNGWIAVVRDITRPMTEPSDILTIPFPELEYAKKARANANL